MIFGIGLGRTGTRSLAAALRLLGVNAVHWDDLGEHVLDHWYESDLTLPPDLDALIEGPFVRWWRAADRLYPGSRFILTTRDKSAWLASVERWLGKRQPPVGGEWYRRRLFYWGTTRFHREIFSAAWDEHHEALERYFADRRDDLLQMNICDRNSDHDIWQQLSDFLGRATPDEPLPHLNRSDV